MKILFFSYVCTFLPSTILQNSAELMQRLEGHTDRVYAVNFHPTEPILASCSADCTIKVWGPGVARGKKKGIM